jgi:hypothetical protein
VGQISSQQAPSLAVKESVVARSLGEEMVLLNLESGLYYSLNSLGGFVWPYIQQGTTPSAIAEAIVSEYEVAPDVAAADLEAFLGQLAEWGLITTG